MRKFSSAVGIFIVSTLLDIAGYVKPYEAVIDGVTKKFWPTASVSLTTLKIVVVIIL